MVESDAPRTDPAPQPVAAGINFRNLEPGTKLRLVGDIIVEVTENPKDGYWLVAKWLSVPQDPSYEGQEAMVMCYDVVDYA